MSERDSAWRYAALSIVILIVAANWRLVSGQMAPHWDAADYFAPAFSLVSDHIRQGRLMLWNPWIAGGSPDFLEPEMGATSPLLLAVAFLFSNPQAGFVTYWLVLWAVGAVGMLYLARHLGAPLWGALVCTLGYAASGFYVGHAEHTSSLCSIAYLPWILMLFDRAIQKGAYWSGVQAGVLYGLSALGGYPQLTIITPGFLALWAVGRGRMRVAIANLILLVVLGFAICSPSYLTMLTDTKGYTDRVGPRSRVEAISSNYLPAGAIVTAASPYLPLLNSSPHPIWPSDLTMISVYLGAAVLTLAVAGWRVFAGWHWWLTVMVLFFTACALGSQLPLRGWLYDWLPPTRYFRNPALLSEYVILLVSSLAALATRHWEVLRKTFLPVAAILATGAFLSFQVTLRLRSDLPAGLHFGVLHLCVMWLGLVAVGIAAWFSDSPLVSRIILTLAVFDFLGTIWLSSPTMYSNDLAPWWRTLNAQHSTNLDLSPSGLNRLMNPPVEVGGYSPQNRNIPLKISVFDSYVTMANRFHRGFLEDAALSRMALGVNRIWFSPAPLVTPLADATFRAFRATVDNGSLPMLIHQPAEMLRLTDHVDSVPSGLLAPGMIPLAVTGLSYRPNSMLFRCESPSAGWVMITDRWAPGWQAYVNGRPAELYGANFIFRAVKIDSGSNNIEMFYRPRYFHPTLALSWGTLLLFFLGELRVLSRKFI